VCDHAGRITAISPSSESLLGWREDEMIGCLLIDYIHPEDIESSVTQIERVASGNALLAYENRYRTRTGDYRLFSWTAVADGDRLHGVGRDITDQRATEEALRQSQKMEAVGQLTGGIAHDFNTLLQGITGSLDIIERRLATGRTAELVPWLSAAKTSAERAAALTHRLLTFSRRQPIDPRPVQINPLLTSMESLLLRTLGEGIEFSLGLDDGLWTTRCDANQLESAILNLAINARDAMPDGGGLSIETSNSHLDMERLPLPTDVAGGDYVCIAVADTGTGMTRDVLAHALEPFFTTKAIGQGTGLGLSMVYGFARQSEGYIDIASEPGQGTTVRLYLPRFADEVAEAEPGVKAEAPAPQASEAVLVVEDEPIVRMLIADVLEELGYQVLEAGDGAAGLEILLSAARIDLLISDIGLPVLNGRQMIEGARAHRPDLKVLFMTGYAENAAQASGFLEPGMALITKPFAVEALAAKIREMLEN
jgi:PAS domain S-box-containing protein